MLITMKYSHYAVEYRLRRRQLFNRPPSPREKCVAVHALLILSLLLTFFQSVQGFIDIANNTFGYLARSNVSKYLNLAKDIHDMRVESNFTIKKDIYVNGRNSPLTLQQLSLTAGELYHDTPMFQMYQDAFDYFGKALEEDSDSNFDGQPISVYADTLVSDLFQLNIPYIEATGVLVINVMQVYWGQLWKVVQGCKRNDISAMNSALDIAVALYVGAGQERNDNSVGYMLYNLAEVAGSRFGQDNGESVVNTKTLETFIALQVNIANNECSETDGYVKFRNLIRKLYRYSTTVLVQWLLFYVQELDSYSSDFVELFSLSLWPQVYSCNGTLAQELINLSIVTDVTESTKGSVISAIQQAYPCWQLSCVDVGPYDGSVIETCNDGIVLKSLNQYSSFTPITSNTRSIATIDQDIHDINVFMQRGEFAVASDFYDRGWNSDPYVLREIVSNADNWTSSLSFSIIDSYYSAASSKLDSILWRFMNNTTAVYLTNQRRGVVVGLLQGLVTHLGVVSLLERSLSICVSSNSTSEALESWEQAVALFVGSMVGTGAVASSLANATTFEGNSLYGISSTYCIDFGTCSKNASTSSMLEKLRSGASELRNASCTDARILFDETIRPLLLIPLIQGYLSNVMIAVTEGNTEAHGYAFAYSYAIVPFFNQVDTVAADVVKTNTPFTSVFKGVLNATQAFNGVRNAIRKIKYLNCADVGNFQYNNLHYGLCFSDLRLPEDLVVEIKVGSSNTPARSPSASTQVPVPTTNGLTSQPSIHPTPKTAFPTSGERIQQDPDPEGLAWGRYTFGNVSVADTFADFTNDIKGIYFANSSEEANSYYRNTAARQIVVGENRTIVRSLEEFSTKAYLFMSDDPIYNFFRIALFDDSTFDDPTIGDGEDYWAFENAIEQLAIRPENGNSPQLASETVTVLGIWHMIAHLLYETTRQCNRKVDRPDLIDSAVALWIGKEQAQGRFNSGWSMYFVAQEAAKNFGAEEGETFINTYLMNNFNVAQELARSCKSDAGASLKLRLLVDETLRVLSLPLFLNLLLYMSEDNFQYVELYALSVIPQGISCDEEDFAFLRDSLFEGYQRDNDLTPELIGSLSSILRCMRFQCGDFSEGFNLNATGNDDLRTLIDAICENLDFASDSNQLSSYVLNNTDAMELSRLDLDVLQIQLLTKAGLTTQAYDIYSNGRNSLGHVGYNSLLELAVSSDRKFAKELFELERDYFDSEFRANRTISDALLNTNGTTLAGASRHQVAEIVFRTLQTSVTHLSVVARLHKAVSLCQDGGEGGPVIDEAAALFVGSIEGPVSGGSGRLSGKFMYALAKEVCEYYRKCESFDATSNQYILYALQEMKDAVLDDSCDKADLILKQSILHQMEIPLVQAILHYAVENEGLSGSTFNDSIASGAAFADAMLPVIEASNAESANTIRSAMKFSVTDVLLEDKDSIFDAIRNAVDGMGIECSRVGIYAVNSLSVCPNNTNSSTDLATPDTTTNLGQNLYVTSKYVQDKANIALDIKQMKVQLTGGSNGLAEDIYRDGENSVIYDASGKQSGIRSISSFSTNITDKLKSNPLFQITVFALRDENNNFGGSDARMYADTIVQESFAISKATRQPIAAEAALVLNVWMEVANDLFDAVTKCNNGQLSDDAGVSIIDGAAAYWIGDGQVAGDSERGHLLYALAEEMGDHFGVSGTQSRINDSVLQRLNQIKMQLSITNACSEGDTARRVRYDVDRLISSMLVVQVQALIHYLRTDDKDRVRIFAHAFVPLVSTCRPSTFLYLKSELLEAPFRESEQTKIVAAIRSTFPCFGISCDDVGVHTLEQDSVVCTDPVELLPIGGYKPSTLVREYAQLDLDVLELDILMQMEAYQAAHDLYIFGKHASLRSPGTGSAISLHSLATASGRSVVPQFSSFKRFFSNDDKYADTLIQQAFDSESTLSANQKRSLAAHIAPFMILQMTALQSMYDAIGACAAGGTERQVTSSKYWDKAAALIIGSLEGTTKAGTSDGRLFFQLGKHFCKEFGTCSTEVVGSAVNNDKIGILLYAGRGAIVSGNCDALRKSTHDIFSQLQVPLIQASLSLATKLTSRNTPKEEMEKLQADAYVYAQALLPLIQDGDRNAATIVQNNFLLKGKSLPDGRHAVVAAYSSVLTDMNVDCSEIGFSPEVDACTGDSKNDAPIGAIIGSLLGVIFVGGVILCRRSKLIKKSREVKPQFMVSTGEFNHNSDLLEKSPYMLERARSDAETDFLNGADADDTMPDDDDAYVKAISRALDSGDDDVSNDEEQSLKANAVI